MVDIVDTIPINNRVNYDVSNGDTTLSLGSSVNSRAIVQVITQSLNETGITFTVVQSNDGLTWNPISLKQKVLELTNDTADDELELGTDLFYDQAIGIQIAGLTGGATGNVQISFTP